MKIFKHCFIKPRGNYISAIRSNCNRFKKAIILNLFKLYYMKNGKELVQFYIYKHLYIYIKYLALLSAYSSLSDENVLMACFVLNIILILYEFGQMITGGIDYWEDL